MKTIVTCFFILCCELFYAQGLTCADPIRFCSETIFVNSNITGDSAPSSSNYGCLGVQPNPTWVYFKVLSSGAMDFTLQCSVDIDFVCWGPFDSIDFCQTYDTTSVISCSYSSTNTEFISFTNAVSEKYYLIMITSYSPTTQTISISQPLAGSAGQGLADCSTVGLNKVNAKEKAIISNPFAEELIIIPSGKIGNIRIYDLLGKLVYEKENLNSDIRINTKEWNSGVYNLIFQTKQGTKAYKIIRD